MQGKAVRLSINTGSVHASTRSRRRARCRPRFAGRGGSAAANVTNIVVTCVQAQFVVIANRDDRTVSAYRIQPDSGNPFGLAGWTSVASGGTSPSGVVLSPDEAHL